MYQITSMLTCCSPKDQAMYEHNTRRSRHFGNKSIAYKWLHDLVYWGKSTLVVVVRYWKQTMLSLLDLLKELHNDKTSAIIAIEKLIQSEDISIDEITKQVSCLSVPLKNDVNSPKTNFKSTYCCNLSSYFTEESLPLKSFAS